MSRHSEWLAMLEAKDEMHKRERTRQAAAVRYAEVESSKLVASGEWQRFQQLLQGAIETAKEELAGIGPALLDPGVVSHDDLLAIKFRGAVLLERVTTLETVIGLPKMLQEDGETAQRELEDLEWLKTAN